MKQFDMRKMVASLAILWAFGLLYVLYLYAQNGKYQPITGNMFINTRTGALFIGHRDSTYATFYSGPVEQVH